MNLKKIFKHERIYLENIEKALEGNNESANIVIDLFDRQKENCFSVVGPRKGALIKIASCDKLSLETRARAMQWLEVWDILGRTGHLTMPDKYKLFCSLKGSTTARHKN